MKKPKMLDERDVRAAYFRRHMDADRFIADVKQAMAERELGESSKRLDELTNASTAMRTTGAADLVEYLRISGQLTREYKRHQKLLDAAYPIRGARP